MSRAWKPEAGAGRMRLVWEPPPLMCDCKGGGQGLAAEHAVLVRRMARLQCLFDELLNDNQRKTAELEAQIVRLRGGLVLARTQSLWGLGASAALVPRAPLLSRAPSSSPGESMPQAEQVLCQVACVGHAHHWLQDGGDCARSGERCESLGAVVVGGIRSRP